MSLIELEKVKLNEWAKKRNDNINFCPNLAEDSFYSVSKDKEIIYEFYYENIPQLKKMLEEKKEIVHDAQIDLICSVATFKYKNTFTNLDMTEKNVRNSKEMISDFIYNF